MFEDAKEMRTKIRVRNSPVEISADYKMFGAYLDDCDDLMPGVLRVPWSSILRISRKGLAALNFPGTIRMSSKRHSIPPTIQGFQWEREGWSSGIMYQMLP